MSRKLGSPHRAFANHYERSRRHAHRAASMALIDAIKSHGCSVPGCGVKMLAAIDAHHVGPKSFGVFEWLCAHAATPINHARAVKELSQCVMLCSNHHRVLHAAEAAGQPLEIDGARVDVGRLPRAHEHTIQWLMSRGADGAAVLCTLVTLEPLQPREQHRQAPHDGAVSIVNGGATDADRAGTQEVIGQG